MSASCSAEAQALLRGSMQTIGTCLGMWTQCLQCQDPSAAGASFLLACTSFAIWMMSPLTYGS